MQRAKKTTGVVFLYNAVRLKAKFSAPVFLVLEAWTAWVKSQKPAIRAIWITGMDPLSPHQPEITVTAPHGLR